MMLIEELATVLAWPTLNAALGSDEEADELYDKVRDMFFDELSTYCNEIDYHMDQECRGDIEYRLISDAEKRLKDEPIVGKHLSYLNKEILGLN